VRISDINGILAGIPKVSRLCSQDQVQPQQINSSGEIGIRIRYGIAIQLKEPSGCG
jgi:hypothetical protein